MKDLVIHFDNGGGATLIVNSEKYSHCYSDMRRLAEDFAQYILNNGSCADWEGNEFEMSKDDNFDNSNGAYYSMDLFDINQMARESKEIEDFFGRNVFEFFHYLRPEWKTLTRPETNRPYNP